MSKQIELTQGKVALVSPEDYAHLSRQTWRVQFRGDNYIAQSAAQPMHRVIMERMTGRRLTDTEQVRHVNGNTLDNRRSNLRLVVVEVEAKPTSEYRGVTYFPWRKRWRARIYSDGKNRSLGYYETPEAAALAYDVAARKYHQGAAKLNFPLDGERAA